MTNEEIKEDLKNGGGKSYHHLRNKHLNYLKYTYGSLAEDIFSECFFKVLNKVNKGELEHYNNIKGYFFNLCKKYVLTEHKQR